MNLVYIHIGTTLPKYIFDSIYQTIIINGVSCKIYILLNDLLINDTIKDLENLNLDIYFDKFYTTNINIIPLSILEKNCKKNIYINYINKLPEHIKNFRESFWINTTMRFYYIHSFMKTFNIENIFHIENDIMMYIPFTIIFEKLELNRINNLCVVRDSETRVVPSIIYIPNYNSINNYITFIDKCFEKSPTFLNDMDLLGMYKDSFEFPLFPENKYNLIFDGAAIGQYLGGIDSRNGKNTIGFVNETCIMNPNNYTFHKNKVYGYINNKYIKNFVCISGKEIVSVANLHIHSKLLYNFSSVFDIQEKDIISGDRILSLCDYVLTTYDIYNFHKNMEKYNKNVIIIKDFKNINFTILNEHFTKSKKKIIKLFIYTHILEYFQTYILPNLNKNIEYVLYIHNSDHPFDNTYQNLIDSPLIKHIFAQNVNIPIHNKVSLLPIGIANEMWPHGKIDKIYSAMVETYKRKKEKNVYVNINPNTFAYRQTVLDEIQGNFEIVKKNIPYPEYLQELSKYRFCLCVRGNGVSCHRSIESLYLGVIPIIINNKFTNMTNFVNYLKYNKIPFYEIKTESLKNINENMFNEELYKKILNECSSSIYNQDFLKLSHYEFTE